MIATNKSRTTTKSTANRIDAVFIRKSTTAQDEAAQIRNVENMLREHANHVPTQYWFVCTVPRANVQGNAEFKRLLDLIEADRVGTVYIESQDRWGTGDVSELFTLLGTLADHGTRLFDLREKCDLTGKDDATEMRVFLGGFKSKKEREDLAYRSLRTRVNNFKETGSWPTGTHPYGYGKRCYAVDGRLLWEWRPTDRSKGQLFYSDADGKLTPGPEGVSIPRKAKGEIIKLVPGNPAYVRAVKLTFDLFVRVGLSRRQISARLNAEELLFNGGLFSHPDVSNVLTNPAYTGDTYFGKTQTGKFKTFDAKGLVVGPDKDMSKFRDSKECSVKRDTHEPLVDRKTWELAQKKLAAEKERTSFAPRNPAYFLKQLFVCGHCGKGLTGRTETHPTTKRKTVIYVCPSYIAGRCNGHSSKCGYQRITHEDAERLLLDKIAEMNLDFDNAGSDQAKQNLKERLARLGHEDDETMEQWQAWINEGIDAFAGFLVDIYGVDYPMLPKVRKWSLNFYCGDEGGDLSLSWVSKGLTDLRTAITSAEEEATQHAAKKVAELSEEHKRLTLAWAKASDMQQAVLKAEIERLETELRQWQPLTVPLSERLKGLYAAEAERQAEREKLLAEWPALESREKGEAMRRLFKTVTLFWDRTFHPASDKPKRPRKTTRPGRYSYALQRERIQWAFAESNLESSS
jgi:hypothetical protein